MKSVFIQHKTTEMKLYLYICLEKQCENDLKNSLNWSGNDYEKNYPKITLGRSAHN